MQRKRGSSRPFWFALHGWLALPIWGLLSLICITGTLCVVSEEITWLFAPEVRAKNPDNADVLLFDALADAVAEAHPAAKIDSIHINEPYFAYLVRVNLPDGGRKVLHVNQYTGQVQGETKGIGFRGFMVALHGWLLFPWQDNYSVGWYVVTAVSIPLLGSLITGLLIFKRFWRVFYRPRLRLGKGARVFWGDLHRLMGVWSIWFIVTISVSGLWFLVQGVLYQNHVNIYPQAPVLNREFVPVTADSRAPALMSVDRAVAGAKAVYPDLQISYIKFPENAYDVFDIRGTRGFSLFRDNATAVYLNPYSGARVGARSIENLLPLQFTAALLVPLHFGDFAGLVSKLIWFFFGCLLSLMVCSGFVIWSKRTFTATQKLRRHSHAIPQLALPNET